MKFDQIFIERIEEYTNLYRQKSIDELRIIEPKWAFGQHLSKLRDADLHPDSKIYTFFLANPKDIVHNADFYESSMCTLFTGNANNDYRITRILHRWENKQFVDPPSLSLSDSKKTLCFDDGRHRTKLSYFLMHPTMPVAIRIEDMDALHNILHLQTF